MSHAGILYRPLMKRVNIGLMALALLTLSLPAASRLHADEPVDQFLSALRARQMHDVVILYLENLKSGNELSADLRERVDYEIGLAHLDQAITISDPADQLQSLVAAQESFDAFLQAQPEHVHALNARMQLGVVQLWRGRNLLRIGEKLPAPQQSKRSTDARELFDDAGKVFAEVSVAAEARLEEFPKVIDSRQRKLLAERNAVRDAIVRSEIYEAEAHKATAESYPDGSNEWETAIKAAGSKFEAIAKKYAENSAGSFLARRGSAECLLALGDKPRALGGYQSLVALRDVDPYVRGQQSLLVPKILELMCDPEIADIRGAIALGETWLTGARGAEGQTPTGLAVHYWVAQAQNMRIEEIKADEEASASQAGQREMRELGQAVLKHVELVASRRGPFQRKSRELLVAYRGDEEVRVTTFIEARSRGQSALDYFRELASPPEAELTPDELDQRQAEKNKALEKAIEYFRLALALGRETVTADETNYARYYLCFCHFHHGDYYDAAVIGEFVARKEPTFELAQACAQLGLEAYRQIYFSDNRGDRGFQTRRLEQMASLIAKQWPNSEDADAAWMLLSDLAIASNNYPQAAAYLDRISAESPRKGVAILKAGQAVWGQYAALSAANGSEQELAGLLERAETNLTDGVKKARDALVAGAAPSYDLLAGELSLAQLYSRSGRTTLAADLLLREQGVIEMLEKGIVGGSPQFPQIAYRTALRCFVQAGNMDAALGVMQQLNEQAEGDGKAQRELTRTYLGLGNELSQQLKALQQDTNKRAQLAKMADGFLGVLDQIADNPEGAAFNEIYWVASTYGTLGETLAELNADKSRGCYDKARRLYEKLVADPSVEEQYRNPLRVRLAESYRFIGNEDSMQKGINLLLAVLNSNENFVDAQQEACQIFERWGDISNQAAYYDLAITGYRDPNSQKRLVWGWATLASKVQRSESYRDMYHLARLNVAECRFKKAMKQSGEEQQKSLRQAKGDIAVTIRLGDPSLGGDAWKPRYESLLKKIQKELGQSPQLGLKEFQTRN
ncbi:MAG: hypothetical protein MPJ50_08675 [Pirellulales bacterium]|nr:hypothetical protein [Pirellulales bacterium]